MKHTPTTKGFAAVAKIIRDDPPGLPDELVWLLPLGVLKPNGLWIEPDDRGRRASQPVLRFRVIESLYSTRSGFYLLHTCRGPDYDLTILSEEEAMAWADKRSVGNICKRQLSSEKNEVRPGYKVCTQCRKSKPPWKFSCTHQSNNKQDDYCKSCREIIRVNQKLEQSIHDTELQLVATRNK
tara:strand:+ start:5117 stop:5662 length:546 start_codon:yes stop_codon:yes gene_type:complete